MSETTDFRAASREQERITDLLDLLPSEGAAVLDLGARDAYIADRLSERFRQVVAVDLMPLRAVNPALHYVQADGAKLPFPDRSFDTTLCAEVLEHIPPHGLAGFCAELQRVTRGGVVVGVPFEQDTRYGRTTCVHCGKVNPPWGHVNSFRLADIDALFPGWQRTEVRYVGALRERTNALSAKLMNLAGNPYGTYTQDEPCVGCGAALEQPRSLRLPARIAAAIALRVTRLQGRLASPQPAWVHVRYARK